MGGNIIAATTRARILDWALRLIPAAIFASTLPAKFLGAPPAVALFTQLGAEPVGRFATGSLEATAVLLLLLPQTVVFGALLSLGLMTGAIFSHLTVLGLAPGGDPSLFIMALVAFAAASALGWRRRSSIPLLGPRFFVGARRPG